jgi:hypothetical protein
MEPCAESNQEEADGGGADRPDVPGGAQPGLHGAWGLSDYQDPDSYWRRRFFILAGGFAILCGMTWGLSVLVGPAKPVQGNGPGNARAALPADGKLPAAYGVSAAPGKGAAAKRRPSQGAALVSPWACPPASIVLSLITSRARYGPGERPQFGVYAVSTAAVACDLVYGPSVVRVMVTSRGHVVWDSFACGSLVPAPAPEPARFTPGVPRVATVSWDRQAGTAGCAGPAGAGAGAGAGAVGTFDVVATTDGHSSPVSTFTLTG